MRTLLRRVLPQRALSFVRLGVEHLTYPPDFTDAEIGLCEAVAPFTMTSPERVVALAGLVRHVTRAGIPGAFVECGVWRGGSMMAAARTLLELDVHDRELHLFDTFAGMSAPTEKDVDSLSRTPAAERLGKAARQEGRSIWCIAGEEDVAANLASTGYPAERVHLVKGKVEDTIPARAPDTIALLRLDTDWYESTRHELAHLYDRLAPGGALVIDDYGYWQGVRAATDELFARLARPPFLHRIDFAGRFCFKP